MAIIYSTYYHDYQISCEEMNDKSNFLAFPLSLNILADYKVSEILEMMDLKVKYLGFGSYYEPLDVEIHEYYEPVLPHNFCTADHPSLLKYARSQTCAISWATAAIGAAEIALHNQGIDEKLSLEYLLTCFEKEMGEDTCDGVWMKDLQEFLQTVGLMSEKEVSRVGNKMCSSTTAKRYVFNIVKPQGWNRGGLMNLVSSGAATISLMALNLLRVRYTDSMNQTDIWFNGQYSQPSVYGVVTGYDDDQKDGYWMVDLAITPCEHIELKLPVLNDETGGNYAGVAGYAFGLKYEVYPTAVPTTNIPTVEIPTTEVPTTEVPTTLPPTTELPTTEVPTTLAPTTPVPTTKPPTTEVPTTEVPTTIPPTTPPVCLSLDFYVRLDKNTLSGPYSTYESVSVNDETDTLMTFDGFEEDSFLQKEGYLRGTRDCLYTLVMKNRDVNSWYDGEWIEVYGINGNIVFKGFMIKRGEESYQFTLYSPINKGDIWKYSNNGSGDWKAVGYNDSQWTSITSGSDPIVEESLTQYFRKSFIGVPGMAAIEAQFRYQYGIVAYINGVEVYRDNMPEGDIGTSTEATNEYTTLDYHGITRSAIVAEEYNSILSVEIHFKNTALQTVVNFNSFLSYLAGISPLINCFVLPNSANAVSSSTFTDSSYMFDWTKDAYGFSSTLPAYIDFTFPFNALLNGFRVYHRDSLDNPSSLVFSVSDGESQIPILDTVGINQYEYQYSNWFYSTTSTKDRSFRVTADSSQEVKIVELQFMICNHQAFSYPEESYSFLIRQPIHIQPLLSSMSSCLVIPSLPAGLSLESDCSISGISSSMSPETMYTITGQVGDVTIKGTLNLTIRNCQGSVIHVLKTDSDYADDGGIKIWNVGTDEVLFEVSFGDPSSIVDEYLCVPDQIEVTLEGFDYWKSGAYLYLFIVRPEGEKEMILKARYDTYQNNAIEYRLNLDTIPDMSEWSYKMGEVPSDWFSTDSTGWLTGSRESFTGSSSIQLYKKSFTVSSKEEASGIILSIRYKYGCIVYINGDEVWRNGVNGELSVSSTPSNEYSELKYRIVTLPADSLVTGENLIAIAIVTNSIDMTSVFDATVRLMGKDPESHIWEFTGSMEGSLIGEVTSLFDFDYSNRLSSDSCDANSVVIILDDDRREWITSVMVQNDYANTYHGVESFTLYGRNSDSESWTEITTISGLEYASENYKSVVYFENNKSYNQFKFENFSSGDTSACTWLIQSLDLLAANMQNEFLFPSVVAYKYVEITPINPLYAGYRNCILDNSLPTGLSLDSWACTITGTPNEVTSQVYWMEATNYKGEQVRTSFTLSVLTCTGTKGFITIKYRTDAYSTSENGYKVFAGRTTSGLPIHYLDVFPVNSAYYEVNLCLDVGIYSLLTTDSFNDGMFGGSGYTLMIDEGAMSTDMMMMENGVGEVTSVFSTFFPFQIEYTDWKVYQSTGEVSSGWNSVSFDDSTWNTYKAADIPATEAITTYIRKSFSISGVSDYQVMNVRVKYAGGVAAYLNGNLVARLNLIEEFDSSTLSITDHDSTVFSKFHVILATAGIQEGTNVFAFEIHRPLTASSSDSVIFDATGVFGVEDCSTVVDSYSSLTSTTPTSGSLDGIMDLDPYTQGTLPNSSGAFIEWTVENLEGSKWNSLIVMGNSATYNFNIDGYYSSTDKKTIGSFLSVSILRKKQPFSVSLAMYGFLQYRWEITSSDSIDLFSLHMAYCKPSLSVCPSVGEYPSVNEGEQSPGSCSSGTGYSYRVCTGGVLGDVINENCS